MSQKSLNTKTPFVNGLSIPFEQFPSIMIELLLRVEQLEKLQASYEIQIQPKDEALNMDEASIFLGIVQLVVSDPSVARGQLMYLRSVAPGTVYSTVGIFSAGQ